MMDDRIELPIDDQIEPTTMAVHQQIHANKQNT
jgi:hypothetical protein